MSSQERTSYFLSWSSSLYKNFKYHLGQLPSPQDFLRRRRCRRRRRRRRRLRHRHRHRHHHHHHHRNIHYNIIQARSSPS